MVLCFLVWLAVISPGSEEITLLLPAKNRRSVFIGCYKVFAVKEGLREYFTCWKVDFHVFCNCFDQMYSKLVAPDAPLPPILTPAPLLLNL